MHSAPGEPLFTKKVEKQNPEKIGLNGDFQGKPLPQVCEVWAFGRLTLYWQ